MQLKSILITPVIYTCADKCSITDFWRLFRSVHNSLMLVNFDERERSVLGWNLEHLAPQSVACCTDCHLRLRISICIQNINRMKYYRVSCIPFAQVLLCVTYNPLTFRFPFFSAHFFQSLVSLVSDIFGLLRRSMIQLTNFGQFRSNAINFDFFWITIKIELNRFLEKVLIFTRRMKIHKYIIKYEKRRREVGVHRQVDSFSLMSQEPIPKYRRQVAYLVFWGVFYRLAFFACVLGPLGFPIYSKKDMHFKSFLNQDYCWC